MKRQVRGVGVGTVSLVMIFAVLCLTVFSMLTLSTSNAEKIMAEKTAAFVKGYYEADALASEIRAKTIASAARGMVPASIDSVEITSEADDGMNLISYACPIDEVQELFVCFVYDGGENKILTWEARPSLDWEPETGIEVWDGSFE